MDDRRTSGKTRRSEGAFFEIIIPILYACDLARNRNKIALLMRTSAVFVSLIGSSSVSVATRRTCVGVAVDTQAITKTSIQPSGVVAPMRFINSNGLPMSAFYTVLYTCQHFVEPASETISFSCNIAG